MLRKDGVAYFFGAFRRCRGKFVNGTCKGTSLGRHDVFSASNRPINRWISAVDMSFNPLENVGE
jgi:hypothetical protein